MVGTALRASFCRNQFQGPREWVSLRRTQEYSREIWVRIPATPLSWDVPCQLCLRFKGSKAVLASGARSKEKESLKYVLGKVLQGTGTVKGKVEEAGLKRGTMGE